MNKQCLHCNAEFHCTPSTAERRFCSRPCWFAWHRGENNNQTKRIAVTCHHCGEEFEKTPAKVVEFNYCSRACAQAEHGKKIVGTKHPNWKGGRLNGRGESWSTVRKAIIARQGHVCGGCGMTEAAHRVKYNKTLSVHHRSPYRLDRNNHPDNLIALCPKCHGIEEAATRRKLSPADIKKMQQNSLESEARGEVRSSPHWFDACPQCDGRKDNRADLCKACRIKANAASKKVHTCSICGNPKANASNRTCWNCRAFGGKPRKTITNISITNDMLQALRAISDDPAEAIRALIERYRPI